MKTGGSSRFVMYRNRYVCQRLNHQHVTIAECYGRMVVPRAIVATSHASVKCHENVAQADVGSPTVASSPVDTKMAGHHKRQVTENRTNTEWYRVGIGIGRNVE